MPVEYKTIDFCELHIEENGHDDIVGRVRATHHRIPKETLRDHPELYHLFHHEYTDHMFSIHGGDPTQEEVLSCRTRFNVQGDLIDRETYRRDMNITGSYKVYTPRQDVFTENL